MSLLTSLIFLTEVHSLEFIHAISVECNVDAKPKRRVNTWRILVLHMRVILNEYSKTTGNSSSPCCLPVTVYHRPFQMFVYVIRCTFVLKKTEMDLKSTSWYFLSYLYYISIRLKLCDFFLHFFRWLAILIVCKIMQRTFSDKLTAVTETFLFSYSFSRMKAYYTKKNCILLDGNNFVHLGHVTGHCVK